MKQLLDFMIQHYKAFILCCVAVLDIIMVCISLHKLTKKGLLKDADIYAFLGEILPHLILSVECVKGGAEKMALVVASALKEIKQKFGLALDDTWTARIQYLVESYLLTPQKKEIKDD